jgi:hypothetical protein
LVFFFLANGFHVFFSEPFFLSCSLDFVGCVGMVRVIGCGIGWLPLPVAVPLCGVPFEIDVRCRGWAVGSTWRVGGAW